ncbi:hypothetical protein [Nitrosopumilus sp. b2]|uniref:hypothetical protein n=1 Tax=Nitrosopumilus sp. b2 TaxID=2109908 RepID=UPI0015F50788|nr:hypothetical protein [Nitrosopumilus sp. b2]KAF6245104.1 hypothetical protein C6989_05305 [Nitrosopumilus sp. b2]
MNREKFHWTLWIGIGFLIAGGISLGILLSGEGPPKFIEETSAYSYAWIIFGISLVSYSIIKRILKSMKNR